MAGALLQCAVAVAAVKTKCQADNNSNALMWHTTGTAHVAPVPSFHVGQLQRQQTFQSNCLQKEPTKRAPRTMPTNSLDGHGLWQEQQQNREQELVQLNDAHKLPASALNAFVSLSMPCHAMPRHELRFTHSFSTSPLPLHFSLSHSLSQRAKK